MNGTQKTPWKRLVVETAAIVVSILLAFAIDAWWQDRLDREMESQHLARLRIELETNIEMMREFTAVELSLDAGYSFIELIEEAQARGVEVIDVRAASLYWLTLASTYDIEKSVFDGLVRSGSLEVIRNQQVVSAIAAWERSVRNYEDVSVAARTTTEMLLLPALHARTDTAFAIRTNPRRTNGLGGEVNLSFSIDNEIKGLIAQKTAILNTSGRALTQMAEAAEAAIGAIDTARPL